MKRLSLLLLFISLLVAIPGQAQTQKKKQAQLIEELTHRVDSLQQAYDSLYNEYQMLTAPANDTDGDILVDDDIENLIEYNSDNIDSLLNIYYIQKQIDVNDFDVATLELDSLTSNIPDEVYIERLRKMNSFIPVQFNKVVKNAIIRYTERMPMATSRIIGLSTYYMPLFEEIFDEYGLPKELKAMAVIESALNPRAVSRARAKGMWQFMYNTAKMYDLEMTSYVDERLDPLTSCRAAARLLKDNYMIFGDWSLAIASYNCGAGNVSKAIRRSGGKTDFWEIYDYLPRETRGYIPAFIAAPIMNRAGHVTVPLARLTEMEPSSMGSRRASRTLRLNSGSSSRNKTPLCARLASPGARRVPPPTRETIEAEWWGERNGRAVTGLKPPESPARLAHEWMRVVSSTSCSVISGSIPGKHRAQSVLPAPGEPTSRKLWAPAAATSSALLTPSIPTTFSKSGTSHASGRQSSLRPPPMHIPEFPPASR